MRAKKRTQNLGFLIPDIIPDPRTLPVLSKGVLRRGVQISLGNIISTREQVGKLSTHSVVAAYLIVILQKENQKDT